MLRFTSLTVEDFGPFKGSQKIDFTEHDGVTFIWGNNGRGKTTLLNAFRYAIFGRFQNRRGANVDLDMITNFESKEEDRYGFKVVLRMNNDGKQYELTRQYKVRSGVVKPTKNDDYEQHIFLKENGSILSNAKREHAMNLVMPEQVSRFFLFDGELLQEYEDLLMEGSNAGEKIKESIEKILGVPVLTNGATDANAVLETYKKAKTKTAQSNKQTEQLGSKIAALEAELQEHTSELEKVRSNLSEELGKKSDLEGKMEENVFVRDLLKKMEELDSSISENRTEHNEVLVSIVSITKDAWKDLIGTRANVILKDIESQMRILEDKAKTYSTTKSFLEDMKTAVVKKHCHICDQVIDESLVGKIQDRIRKIEADFGNLSPEENKQLQDHQVRKSTLEPIRSGSSKVALEMYEKQLGTLKVAISDQERMLKSIKEQLEKHGDIDNLSSSNRDNLQDLAQCLMRIENLREGDKNETRIIAELRNTLKTLNANLDRTATSKDMIFAKKRVELCEQIYKIFEEGIMAYRDKLKSRVEKDATELFVKISNDPDYVKLSINENYGLSIIHRSGETIPLRSAGFEHIVALSLIGALHKNAPLRGPIIMDSPFGRLDPTHKENITRILPSLSEQVVLLAYTYEIDEQKARMTLGDSLKREYRLTRKTSFHTRIEQN